MSKKMIFLFLILFTIFGASVAKAADDIVPSAAVLESAFVTDYQVKAGDTLAAVAENMGSDWGLVAAMNNLQDPNAIYPGQQLLVPVTRQDYVVVKPGDTLWGIARRFEVDAENLAFENGILQPGKLAVGTSLRIPNLPIIPTFLKNDAVRTLASRGSGESFFSWPLSGAVTSAYGQRGDDFHHGIDISGGNSGLVRSVAAGQVTFAGWLNNIYGNTVIVTHGRKYRTLYAHNSSNIVNLGDTVAAGQPLARVGSTGRSTGAHVHLELYRDGVPVNPAKLLKSGQMPGANPAI